MLDIYEPIIYVRYHYYNIYCHDFNFCQFVLNINYSRMLLKTDLN